jgi:hypothetical protein
MAGLGLDVDLPGETPKYLRIRSDLRDRITNPRPSAFRIKVGRPDAKIIAGSRTSSVDAEPA